MSQYLEPFGKQLKKWIRNDCIQKYVATDDSCVGLGRLHIHKTTIEPSKPRICLKYVSLLISITFWNF